MKIIIKKKLTDKGSLTEKPGYTKANSAADKVEKKKYPAGYEKLKKAKLAQHEVMGKVSGNKVEVEKRFKPQAKEIALHDEVELKKLRKKK